MEGKCCMRVLQARQSRTRQRSEGFRKDKNLVFQGAGSSGRTQNQERWHLASGLGTIPEELCLIWSGVGGRRAA